MADPITGGVEQVVKKRYWHTQYLGVQLRQAQKNLCLPAL